ncbi:MAG: sporulation integral membrane protein YtvI [Lutisporaceae bacterium]
MLKVDVERYLGYLFKGLIYLIVIVLIYLSGKILFTYFTPFITALFLAMLIEPLVKLFQRLKLGRGFSVVLSIILFLGSFISLSAFAIARLVFELKDLYNSLPNYYNDVYNLIDMFIQRATEFYLQLTPGATNILKDFLDTTFDKLKIVVGQMLTQTPSSTFSFIGKLSGFLLYLIVTLLATFFLSKDKDIIIGFIYRQLSPSWKEKVLSLKKDLFQALAGFLKAQMILLSVTFLESYIGLSILGIKYALIFAIVIALVDILPILGTGSIYVPAAIINVILGNYRIAISLLVLYGIIVVVRYMIEPKVVGAQLGIHPIVALASIFAGLKIMGVAGVILGPTIVVVVKAFQNARILPRFK